MRASLLALLAVLFVSAAAGAAEPHARAKAMKKPPPPPLFNSVEEIALMATETARVNIAEHGPYGPYNNCTSFSLAFHQRCVRENRTCVSVRAACEGETTGHAFNLIQTLDRTWRVIEPQAIVSPVVGPGFLTPKAIPPKALCQVMQKGLRPDGACPCYMTQYSPEPLPENTNPVIYCARNPRFSTRPRSVETLRDCQSCCARSISYHLPGRHPAWDIWARTCMDACHSHFSVPIDASDFSAPRRSDSLAVAYGRRCVAGTSSSREGTLYEQCRGACFDGARLHHFPRETLPACVSVCNAAFL